MTNLLLSVLLASFAAAYLLELSELVLDWFFTKSEINKLLSIPVSLGCIYVTQREWTLMMIVLVPATAFLALAINLLINRPTVVQQQRMPRLY